MNIYENSAQNEIEKDNLFEKIFNSIPSAMICIDNRFNIIQINEEAEKFIGLKKENLTGNLLFDRIEQFEPFRELIANSLNSDNQNKISNSNIYVNGEIKSVECVFFPVNVNNSKILTIKIEDNTKKIKEQEYYIQTEKMLSVGGLAAGIAHELNNPLSGIMHGVQNLERRLVTDLSENKKACEESGIKINNLNDYFKKRNIIHIFDGIRSSVEKASDIIRNMLRFSRRDEKSFSFKTPEEIIENSLNMLRYDVELNKMYNIDNVSIIKDIDKEQKLRCIESEIEQVIQSLFRNSLSAFSEYNTKDPRIIIRSFYEDNYEVIQFEDNGPGIEESIKKRIFEPFFSKTPGGKGLGLGLAVAYFIITENHNGIFNLESIEGSGTRFTIKLPQRGVQND
jgi:PAS domain S-box-containing protein